MTTESSSYDMSPGLLRQRRNVFITSLLAIFIYTAGAKISAVNASITTIIFERPDVIPWFLIVFQTYYLVRFYQYLSQEENLHIVDTFYTQWCGYSFRKLMKLKEAALPDLKKFGGEFDFRKMNKVGRWRREVSVVYMRGNYGGETKKTFEIDIRNFLFEAFYAVLFVIFKRSYATDYLLPFLVGTAGLYANVQLLIF